ncbi:hypothetical protein EGW08_012438 [Elysia chlorotica]|uniref:Uncharacterized protein n=1 Tax=Elysia chlorotica TaxID=188477 RepID=A0A433TDX0_ELYCH|nr:hypothetical protein EGW08_012438 [Elysia chlorotica]
MHVQGRPLSRVQHRKWPSITRPARVAPRLVFPFFLPGFCFMASVLSLLPLSCEMSSGTSGFAMVTSADPSLRGLLDARTGVNYHRKISIARHWPPGRPDFYVRTLAWSSQGRPVIYLFICPLTASDPWPGRRHALSGQCGTERRPVGVRRPPGRTTLPLFYSGFTHWTMRRVVIDLGLSTVKVVRRPRQFAVVAADVIVVDNGYHRAGTLYSGQPVEMWIGALARHPETLAWEGSSCRSRVSQLFVLPQLVCAGPPGCSAPDLSPTISALPQGPTARSRDAAHEERTAAAITQAKITGQCYC